MRFSLEVLTLMLWSLRVAASEANLCSSVDGQTWKGVYHETRSSNNPQYRASTAGYCLASAKLVSNGGHGLIIRDLRYDHCSLFNTSTTDVSGTWKDVQAPNVTSMNRQPGFQTVDGSDCHAGSLKFNTTRTTPGAPLEETMEGDLTQQALEIRRTQSSAGSASSGNLHATWRFYAPAASLDSGLSTIQSRETGLCLDVSRGVPPGNPKNGSRLELKKCNGQQLWRVENGQIVLAGSDPPKCIDLLGFDTTNGNQLAVWDCSTVPQQEWEMNTGMISAAYSTTFKCMDLRNGGADGDAVQIWDCLNGAWNQQWVVTTNTSRIERASHIII